MAKVLVLYYSSWGHMEAMAQAAAKGAASAGADVTIKRAPELVPEDVAKAAHYKLDQDMVTAGALLHDLGKIWELELQASIEYTDDGRLLGHLPMTVLYIDRRISIAAGGFSGGG